MLMCVPLLIIFVFCCNQPFTAYYAPPDYLLLWRMPRRIALAPAVGCVVSYLCTVPIEDDEVIRQTGKVTERRQILGTIKTKVNTDKWRIDFGPLGGVRVLRSTVFTVKKPPNFHPDPPGPSSSSSSSVSIASGTDPEIDGPPTKKELLMPPEKASKSHQRQNRSNKTRRRIHLVHLLLAPRIAGGLVLCQGSSP